MSALILATKLYIPVPQPGVVSRPRLVERLNEGLHRKITLISAAAGFGKTTLVSEWVADCGMPVAWLSLDEADSDPARFLTYLIAALQTVSPEIGASAMASLQSPQPPPADSVLTVLLNDIASVRDRFMLVFDDYHLVDSSEVDRAFAFLVDHLPQQMHLVIASREDPQLPLSRLRARNQLTEMRAADLRFTPGEVAEFLQQVTGLALSEDDIVALEARTEGWIAGLQLAAISMQGQGQDDASSFVRSFTGSHRFILDYLVEEVLQQQPEHIQTFLLHTAILDRMCGPLCDTVMLATPSTGQTTLAYLEQANLFLVPLDNERRWYRYHHLFAELLRQRLQQASTGPEVDELHRRASGWFEEQGLEIEAFHHAAAAHDIDSAERLISGNGIPLYVRGGAVPVLNWLESLPAPTLDARPWLWVMFATVLSIIGKIGQVEPKLRAAEAVLHNVESAETMHHLTLRIGDLRELLGILTANPDQMAATIDRYSNALEHPESVETAALWKLGLAYQNTGRRAEAMRAFASGVSMSEAAGNVHVTILTSTSLGRELEFDGQLNRAVERYRRVLELVGNPPGPVACEAHAGLARITCEWNDLDTAQQHAIQSLHLARQVEISSFVTSEIILAHLQMVRGDVTGAIESLAATTASVLGGPFEFKLPDIAAAQVRALLRHGDLQSAEELAWQFDLPLAQARVRLAQGNAAGALAILRPYCEEIEKEGWGGERLRAIVLLSLAHQSGGDLDAALLALHDALAMAEPEGFIRTFVDEGPPMAGLLAEAAARGIRPDYTAMLLAAFEPDEQPVIPAAVQRQPSTLIEPLSERELEILQLVAQGLSNHQIADRLFLALSTVKGHNRNIYGKLGVQRRTEAVARARELGLI